MDAVNFSIAKDFSPFAGPRLARQGSHSGEALRKTLLKKLKAYQGKMIVNLDGTKGMGSSFLDEAFGGLIRKEGMTKDELDRRIKFEARVDPSYIVTIRDSLARAAAERGDGR